jgi:hypothetical protein
VMGYVIPYVIELDLAAEPEEVMGVVDGGLQAPLLEDGEDAIKRRKEKQEADAAKVIHALRSM